MLLDITVPVLVLIILFVLNAQQDARLVVLLLHVQHAHKDTYMITQLLLALNVVIQIVEHAQLQLVHALPVKVHISWMPPMVTHVHNAQQTV